MGVVRRVLAGTVVLGVACTLAGTPVATPRIGYDAHLAPDRAVLAATTRVEDAAFARPVLLHRRPARDHAAVTRNGTPWVAISRTGTDQVPVVALHAYQQAAAVMDSAAPGCRIPWTLLAAVGRVESDNGQFAGSHLGTDGVARPPIFGLPLDGRGPVARVPDTDNGTLDHDRTWDRAVGPMQFIPSTWRLVAVDGDGDGVRNPQDINDAALAAAIYLCAGGGDLSTRAGAAAAVLRYNPSARYVATVLAYQRAYQDAGLPATSPVFTTHRLGPAHPSRTANAEGALTKTAAPKPTRPSRDAATSPARTTPSTPSTPSVSPTPAPTPAPTPGPTPAPSPSAPTLVPLQGTWTACTPTGATPPADPTVPTYCVGGTVLDLGLTAPDGSTAQPDPLTATAAADFDGDGTVETLAAELAGLVGTTVTVQVAQGTDPATVYAIGDRPYRADDGTLVPGATDPNGP